LLSSNKILFVADFFAHQIPGGGELNNDVLIDGLRDLGYEVQCVNSHLVKHRDLSCQGIIISNFVNLSEINKKQIQSRNYIIYEHDHKYLVNRNPNIYSNYQAPEEHIINKDFYSNAKAVLCQSEFHAEIVRKNLKIDNIVSLGGNLWSDDHFSLLEEMSRTPKDNKFAIMDSSTPHKNTREAILYCQAMGLEYVLLAPSQPSVFLRELGRHESLVFFPKTPETLSRIVVEARMMGMKTKTTPNIGAVHEPWFSKKGANLIEEMRTKRAEILNLVSLRCFHE
jgi:hypothetical protein